MARIPGIYTTELVRSYVDVSDSVDVHFQDPLSRCRGQHPVVRFAGGLNPIV